MVTIILSLNISDGLWITNFYSHVFTWMADIWRFIRPSHPIYFIERWTVRFVCKMNQSLHKIYLFKRNGQRNKHNEHNEILTTIERSEEEKKKYRNSNVVLIHWGTFIFYLWTEMTEKEEIPIETKKKKNCFFWLSRSHIHFIFFDYANTWRRVYLPYASIRMIR